MKYVKFRALNEEERKYLLKDLRKTLTDTIVIEDILVPSVVMELAMNIKVQRKMISSKGSVKFCCVEYRGRYIDDTEMCRDMFIRAVDEIRCRNYSNEVLELEGKIDECKEVLESLKSPSYVPLFDEFRCLEIESEMRKLERLKDRKIEVDFKCNKYHQRCEKWV